MSQTLVTTLNFTSPSFIKNDYKYNVNNIKSNSNYVGTLRLIGENKSSIGSYAVNNEHEHEEDHKPSFIKKSAIFLGHFTGISALIYPLKKSIFSPEHEHGDGNGRTFINDFDEFIHNISLSTGNAHQEYNVNKWLDLSHTMSIHGDLSALGSFIPILAFILPFAYLGTKSGVEGAIAGQQDIDQTKKNIRKTEDLLASAFTNALANLKQHIEKETDLKNKQKLSILYNVLSTKRNMLEHKLIAQLKDLENHKLDKSFFIFAMLAGSFLSYNFILQFAMKMASIANESTAFLNVLSGATVASTILSPLSTLWATIMGYKSVKKSGRQLKEAKKDDINIKSRFKQDLGESFLYNNQDRKEFEDFMSVVNAKSKYLTEFFKKYLTSNSVFTFSAAAATGFLTAKAILTVLALVGVAKLSVLSFGAIPIAIITGVGAVGAAAYLTGHVIQHKKQKQKEVMKYDSLFQYHQFLNLLGNNALQPVDEDLSQLHDLNSYKKITTIFDSYTNLNLNLNSNFDLRKYKQIESLIGKDFINTENHSANITQKGLRNYHQIMNIVYDVKTESNNQMQPINLTNNYIATHQSIYKYNQILNVIANNNIRRITKEQKAQEIQETYVKLAQSTTIMHSRMLNPSKQLFEGVRSLSQDIAKDNHKKYKQVLYSNEKNINIFKSIKETLGMTGGALSRKIIKGVYSLTHSKNKKEEGFEADKKRFAKDKHYTIFRPNTMNDYSVQDELKDEKYQEKITSLLRNYLINQQKLVAEKKNQTNILLKVLPIIKNQPKEFSSINVNTALINNIEITDDRAVRNLLDSDDNHLKDILDMAQLSKKESRILRVDVDSLDEEHVRKCFAWYKDIKYDTKANLNSNIYQFLTQTARKEYEYYRNYVFNMERAMIRT